MNSNDHTSETPQGDSRIADQNVERLLTSAYDPEMPDEDFVRRVGQHVLAEARSGQVTDNEQLVRPSSRIKRRLLRWETVPWIIIVVLVILLVGLPVRLTPKTVPEFYREGDIVWIDGKAYMASDSRSRSNEPQPILRTRAGSVTPAGAEIRPVTLVGGPGLTPRLRPAIDERPSIEIGESIATGPGERRCVTLPDGSTLYVNESTAVTVDDIRSISLQRGQVYVDVVPRDEKDADAKFVVKTPDHNVTALGTKFATQAGDSKTTVLVTQGQVQVSGVQAPEAVSKIQTPTRRASFEVVPVLSPEGTTAGSLGRKPQEDRTETDGSPVGATQGGAFALLSPLRGSKLRLATHTWGSRTHGYTQVRNRKAVSRDSLGRKSQVEGAIHAFKSRSDDRSRQCPERHMPPLRGSVAWLTANLGLASQASACRRVATEDVYCNLGFRPRLSAAAASRLMGHWFSIPWAYAQGYMLPSLRDCQLAQLKNPRVGLLSQPVVVRAGQQLSVDSKSGDEDEPVVTAAARASHLLSWTKDLMAAAESPLVPASDHSGGSLIAIDPDGQEMKLSLRKYHVDVHIEDGFARTTIDQTYFNHKSWRLEGKFYFPLPADASISRLAMYAGGHLMEGGMAERDHARNVFETIKHRALDPALLEWVDGSTFKMRVFPLEGRQEKRIVLSYTQRLANHYGRMQYRFPTGNSKEKVRDRSIKIRVADGKRLKWQCDSHDLKATSTDTDVTLSTEGKDVSLDRDIVVNLTEDAGKASDGVEGESKVVRGSPDRVQEATEGLKNSRDLRSGIAGGSGDPPATDTGGSGEPPRTGRTGRDTRTGAARFSTVKHDDSKYFMVRYRPQLKTKPRGERRDWIFLFDADGSRDPLLARIQVDVIRTMLKNAEHDDRFAIVTAGTRTRTYSPDLKPATPGNIADAIKMLDRTHLIGALDLEKALKVCQDYAKAAENPTLVHVGGGVPILGERRTHILLKRLPGKTEYVGVGVGKRWNRSFMKAAASETGGYFTQINPDEPVGWRAFDLMSTLCTPRLLDLHVESDNEAIEFLAFSDSAIHGEEICAIARVKPDQEMPKTVRVHGRLDGEPFDQAIAVNEVPDGAGYLPRQWAKLAIDAMVSENAEKYKSKIIALSKSMYVMSPFTSLLVLENDEMYEQYNVDRGRKDHWALYPCPEKIEVVHEPLSGPEPEPTNVEKKESKPSPRTVLQTLLVRRGRYGYTTAVPSGINAFQFKTIYTDVSVPDGGTMLLGGIKLRVNDRWVSIDDIGPNVMFGLNPSGLPTADLDLTFLRDLNRTIGGTSSTNGEFIRRVYLDLVREIPPSSDLQTYLDEATWETYPDLEFDHLIDLITTTIRPDTWDEVGGLGSIEGFSSNLSLVISQTQTVHEQLQSYYKWLERGYPAEDPLLLASSGNGDGYLPLAMFADERPIMYPSKNIWEQITRAREKYRCIDVTRAADLIIFKALGEDTVIESIETPLGDVVEYLEDLHGIHIELDLEALLPIGVSSETLVTRNLTDMSLRSALRLLLNEFDATFAVTNDILVITTPEAAGNNFNSKEELLLQIRTRIGPPAGIDPAVLNDPRLLELWSKALRRRLEQKPKPPSLLYFTPRIGNDQRPFRHLLAYAPGLNTTRADILSVLNREAGLSNPPVAGKIDVNARKLIDAALSQVWQTVSLRDSSGRGLLRLQVDGQGRYRYERKTEYGLREMVICDGDSLWHLYPELGLGARRTNSRFHRAELASLVPWHPASADDLAVGADLKMVGPRTIAVVPHDFRDAQDESGKPIPYSRVHLVFADDDRLAERRLVEIPSGKTIARVTYAEDGTVRALDAEGKTQSELQLAVTPSAAPDLKPKTGELVILPMPIRRASHIYESVAKKDASASVGKEGDVLRQIVSEAAFLAGDFAHWDEEDALSLVAANHWQDPEGLQNVIAERFFAKGDRRIGFYVLLLSSGLNWNPSVPVKLRNDLSDGLNPLADHPDSPLAQYIMTQLKLRNEDSRKVPAAIATTQDGFIGQLSEYRRLYTLWGRSRKATKDARQFLRELDQLFAFVNRCNSPMFAFTLMRRAQYHLDDVFSHVSKELNSFPQQTPPHKDKHQLNSRIAEALLRFAKQGVTSYVVQYELARALANSGDKAKARQLFLRLYEDTFDQHILPPIDHAFLEAIGDVDDPFAEPFDTSELHGGDFSDLMEKTCQQLIDQGRRPTAIALVWQCRQLNQTGLANELLGQTLAGTADHERIATTLAAIEYLVQEGEHRRADALLQPLLNDEDIAGTSELWHLAAQIADNGEMLARALHYKQRAIELELQQFDSTVNLQWVREQYGDLLDRYGKLAGIVAQPESEIASELVRDVVKTADRWRSLDNDPTAACNAAARVLTTLGNDELAWDYLTTPLALKPNEAAPWVDLARSMQDTSQIEMADRTYAAAFEAEPTNAEILWDHARMLDQNGQSARAMQLYSQIAGSDWQPRFNSIRQQAKSIVDRNLRDVQK